MATGYGLLKLAMATLRLEKEAVVLAREELTGGRHYRATMRERGERGGRGGGRRRRTEGDKDG